MAIFNDFTFFGPQHGQDPWNGWKQSCNGHRLVLGTDGPNHWVQFDPLWAGIMSKQLRELTPATSYSVSMRVKRLGNSSKIPRLSLELDGTQLEGEFDVTDSEWQTFHWQFQATASAHALGLIGRRDAESGCLNLDCCFDDIHICPMLITEDFEHTPIQHIQAGQSLPLPTMLITLLEGSQGVAGIENYAQYPQPGLLEGNGIVLQRKEANPSTPQRLEVRFVVPCAMLKFAWTYRHHAGEVEFYDEQSNLLATQSFSGEPRHHWVEFQAPSDRKIAAIVVVARDYCFLDFFSLSQSRPA
jgi:hypothetical protein